MRETYKKGSTRRLCKDCPQLVITQETMNSQQRGNRKLMKNYYFTLGFFFFLTKLSSLEIDHQVII